MAPRAFGPRGGVVLADGVVSVTGAACAAAGCTSVAEATTATAPRTRTRRHAPMGPVRHLRWDERRPMTACTTQLMLSFPGHEINSAARASCPSSLGPPSASGIGPGQRDVSFDVRIARLPLTVFELVLAGVTPWTTTRGSWLSTGHGHRWLPGISTTWRRRCSRLPGSGPARLTPTTAITAVEAPASGTRP